MCKHNNLNKIEEIKIISDIWEKLIFIILLALMITRKVKIYQNSKYCFWFAFFLIVYCLISKKELLILQINDCKKTRYLLSPNLNGHAFYPFKILQSRLLEKHGKLNIDIIPNKKTTQGKYELDNRYLGKYIFTEFLMTFKKYLGKEKKYIL